MSQPGTTLATRATTSARLGIPGAGAASRAGARSRRSTPSWFTVLSGPGSGSFTARRALPWILVGPTCLAVAAGHMINAGWLSPLVALFIAAFLASASLLWLVVGRAVERNARYEACARLGTVEADKALLLGEIFHRVNNNLQQISSLISLEASAVEDEGANEAFRALSGRVLAIASVHQRIVADPAVSRVPLGEVVGTLCANVAARLGVHPNTVRIGCNAEEVRVSIESALSIGLVVNELVGKAAAHAVEASRRGDIVVDVSCCSSGHVVVKVTDGYAEDVTPLLGDNVGGRIVGGLVRQLGGTLESVGGSIVVSYPPAVREREVDA